VSRREGNRDRGRDKDKDKERLPPHWQRVQGAIWLIGLAFLFWYGKIFPGILVLVAISGLVQAGIMAYVNRQQESEALATTREERLPENCPNCGGPLNAASVRWQGKQSAICPYCGSTVKTMVKSPS